MNRPRGTPILYYHCVAENCLSVKPSIFSAQMSYLKEHCFRAICMKEWRILAESGQSHSKNVVLTFDDGFGKLPENVFPLLMEFGFRATFFVVPGYVGKTLWGDPVTRTWRWEEQPGRIAFPMMTWSHIARMSEAGMEIASHTLSHRNLTDLSEADARREIRESKEYLEEKLAIPIRGFCYPRGRVNASLAGLVEEAGYEYACTTQPGYAAPDSDRFLLPRIPGPASLSDFIFQVRGFRQTVFNQCALRLARKFEPLTRTMYDRELRTRTHNRERDRQKPGKV